MSRDVNERLRNFARTLLERRGALVEWPDTAEEGLAILPPPLARQLGAEALTLTHDATVETHARGAWAVNLATDFLDRAAGLIEAEPSEARFRLENLYLKKSAMDEPVARFFAWPNARVRVAGAAAVRLEYHFWHVHAAIGSDEPWEDLISVTINAASRARVELPDPLGMADAIESEAGDSPVKPDADLARRAAAEIAEVRAAPFVARLEGRLERDRQRLKEYYTALTAETIGAKVRSADDLQQQEDKRRVVQLELRRKLLELDERYALRTQLEPLALVRLDMPVLRVECEVLKRRAKGLCAVYWNPLRKELEPLACSRCQANITTVHFDDAITPLCARCVQG